MFENYEKAKNRKAPKWAGPLIIAGIIVHAAMLMTMWIKSIWNVEKLELPKGRVSIGGFAPPPPPPPLKGGKKPEDAKKPKEPPKKKVMDTVQPVKAPDKIVENASSAADEGPEDGDPNGDPNGAADGIQGGVPQAAPPPPPPPPPAPPQTVAPTAVEANRISGDKMIQPDDVTKTEIGRSGKAKIVASYKICLSASGSINSVSQLKSSGFPAYDSKLQREMKSNWKYRPFMVNGKAAPVCTAVTFVYSQK